MICDVCRYAVDTGLCRKRCGLCGMPVTVKSQLRADGTLRRHYVLVTGLEGPTLRVACADEGKLPVRTPDHSACRGCTCQHQPKGAHRVPQS